MTILRESPWYYEILREGVEQGLEQGLERARAGSNEASNKASNKVRLIACNEFSCIVFTRPQTPSLRSCGSCGMNKLAM